MRPPRCCGSSRPAAAWGCDREPAAARRRRRGGPAGPALRWPAGRVLVVEDGDRMATLLRRGFGEEGYAVDVAVTGPEALTRASEQPYDAIVLDVMLPGASGVEVCRELRRRGRWTPVVMVTARDAISDRIDGLDSGADDY